MFQHILVPLDGSPRAEQALPTAARIARASGGTITLLRVVSHPIEVYLSPPEFFSHMKRIQGTSVARAREYLERIASSDDLKGIKVRTDVLTGQVAKTILMFTEIQLIDLVVMCSHSADEHRRWPIGSVAHKIALHCRVPVLVLREGHAVPPLPQETMEYWPGMLVTLDGSPQAEAVLQPAVLLCASLAAPAQGAIHLLHVLRPLRVEDDEYEAVIAGINKQMIAEAKTYLHTVRQRLQEMDIAKLNLKITSSVVVDPDVAATIIEVAENGAFTENTHGLRSCDMVAMATHGRSGPSRWVVGSVTERVLNASNLPLLIVRSAEASQEA
jgi:nucleotide-binding universal stress UspA family protein